MKIKNGLNESISTASGSEVQVLKQIDKDIRMPYSLIRNSSSKTSFQIGQTIFLKFLRKDIKNFSNIYIGSIDKSNLYDNHNRTQINHAFENLEKRDDWSMNYQQSNKISKDQMENRILEEPGI